MLKPASVHQLNQPDHLFSAAGQFMVGLNPKINTCYRKAIFSNQYCVHHMVGK